jgi:O-antigen/teichoic acid export membrane protein
MSRVRRAFVMASLEQYVALLVNLGLVVALSRLLSPSQIGIAVIGLGICAITFALREFFTAEFLIQRPTVRRIEVQTSGTILICVTSLLGLCLLMAAPALSRAYGTPELVTFIRVMIVAALIETLSFPAVALLRRDLNFGGTAMIRIAALLAMALVAVVLAAKGFGFMSYAWGNLAAACVTAAMATILRPAAFPRRPTLASWRVIVDFGRFRGASGMVDRIYDAIPQLVLGRFMPMADVGLYNRLNAVCSIPDRLLLGSVFAIAFPALSLHVRLGHDVGRSYMHVIGLITVVYWPALFLMVLLAEPLVLAVLGSAWLQVVPLVRIVGVASLFFFPVILTHPLLMANGRNKSAFTQNLMSKLIAAVVICSASPFGLKAMAYSQFIAIPLEMVLALWFARSVVQFAWRDFAAVVGRSALVTVATLSGPLGFALWHRPDLVFNAGEVAIVLLLAAGGWLAGVRAMAHPVLGEIVAAWQSRRTANEEQPLGAAVEDAGRG